MGTALAILGWSIFGLAILLGLALDVVGLFGNVLIWCAVASAWFLSGQEYFSLTVVLILAGLVVLGEVLEMVSSAYGAKRYGGGKGAMLAALVGCLVGAVLGTAIPLPILGNLIGACVGGFVGAFSYEFLVQQRSRQDAMQVGVGATLGKLGGIFAKMIVGVVMVIIMAFTF